MPNNPKLFAHNTCLEITFRTEEGLPLVATPFMLSLISSCLARAQTLFPVTICHFIVMANHMHFIIVVDSPDNVPSFFGYLKGELAHAINTLLGRAKHTVWCDGYDSPRILDAEKATERILYLYSNPQKAGLVDSIDDYPQLSSWEAFVAGEGETSTLRIPRDVVPKLPKATLSFQAQEEIAQNLLSQGREQCTLTIKPNAWMKCFPELADKTPDQIRETIIARLRDIERNYKASREKPVIGAHALRLQTMQKSYTPAKRGKRMLCLSSAKETRKTFIEWYQSCITEARAWYAAWKAGERNGLPPPGMFAPGCALFSNLLPHALPA